MKIRIHLHPSDPPASIIVDCGVGDCCYDIYQKVYELAHPAWQERMDKAGGVYSPDNRLSHKGIQLENIEPLSKYSITDGAELRMTIGRQPCQDSLATGNHCHSCGKIFEKAEDLRYHPGTLSRREWVYGMTTHWRWNCCDKIIPHPSSCHHPEGCQQGLCKECRPDCACHKARKIREKEEEDW